MRNPTRRQVMQWAMGSATLAALDTLAPLGRCFAAEEAGKAARPHVIFIAVDDLRPQMGCYGNPQMITPHMDELARSGFLFTRNYCQYAVCGPSRDCVLTGLRPDTTGVTDNTRNYRESLPDWVSLPEHFARHGYRTVKTGKISHVNRDDGAFQEVMNEWGVKGVSLYNDPRNKADMLKNMDVIQEKEQAGEKLTSHERYVMMIGPHYEAAEVPDNVYSDGAMADLAIGEIGRMKESAQPTFLAVGFHRPHLPFNCPQKYWDLYDAQQFKLPEPGPRPADVPAIAYMKYDELGDYKQAPKHDTLDEEQARRMVHGYCASVSFVDAQVGRIMQALRDAGLLENSIVMLWGDHGWHLGEHGLWGKDTNFEEATRAPLLVRAPGVAGGAKIEGLTELVDLYPTLCELAGLPIPEKLDGLSFAPLLREPQRAWKRAAFSQIRREDSVGSSIRTARHRYTVWTDRRDGRRLGEELYDHHVDAGENENLAAHPDYVPVAVQLAEQLERGWRDALPTTPSQS